MNVCLGPVSLKRAVRRIDILKAFATAIGSDIMDRFVKKHPASMEFTPVLSAVAMGRRRKYSFKTTLVIYNVYATRKEQANGPVIHVAV